jgi:hypothetical protein
MTIPQIAGLTVEVQAEGSGPETKRGEFCSLPCYPASLLLFS